MLDYFVKHNDKYIILKTIDKNIDIEYCDILSKKYPYFYAKYKNNICLIYGGHKISLNNCPKLLYKLQLINKLKKYNKNALKKIYRQTHLNKNLKLFMSKSKYIKKLYFCHDIDDFLVLT
jgi:hypothetical protein